MDKIFDQKFIAKFLNYVNILGGIDVKMKELHWTTQSTEMHNATDNICWRTRSLLDNVVEQFMALTSRDVFGDNFFRPTIELDEYNDLLAYTKKVGASFKKFIEKQEDERLAGISSAIDSFIEDALVNSYRSELR